MSPSRPRRGDRGGSRRRPATARISNGLALRRNPGYRLRCSERRNGSSRERPGPPATAKQQAQLFASPERSLYSKGEEGPIKRRPAVCNGFLRRASRSYEGPVNTNLRPFLQTRPACLAALECTHPPVPPAGAVYLSQSVCCNGPVQGVRCSGGSSQLSPPGTQRTSGEYTRPTSASCAPSGESSRHERALYSIQQFPYFQCYSGSQA